MRVLWTVIVALACAVAFPSYSAETESYGDSASDWARRVRLGGSVNTGFYGGQDNTFFRKDVDGFLIWDARFFIDASLGEDVKLVDTTIVRDLGFSFEWDLVRLGNLANRVGELYVDFQGIGGTGWVNAQVGRFQIPVGENYLLFSKGYRNNPFITNTVGGPWFWDEGIRAFGSDSKHRFGYVASVSDGSTSFNTDANMWKQITLKLFWDPTKWLHVSASGLRSGELGSKTEAASGALWLGETWARAFGSGSSVDNYSYGVVVPNGPNVLHYTWFVGGDAVVDLPDILRFWVAYGYYNIDSTGLDEYDRSLQYWVAELVLRGGKLSPYLKDVYLGARANALATYDHNRGYLLDFRYGSTLGYNMESLTAYSIVLGWNLNKYVTIRGEYTIQDITLVDGAAQVPAFRAAANDSNSFGIEVRAAF